MSEDDPRHGLPDHQHALGEYLQALLDDVEEYNPDAEPPEGEPPVSSGPTPSSAPSSPRPASPAAEPEPAPAPPAAAAEPDRSAGRKAPSRPVAERPRMPQAPPPTVAPAQPEPEPESPPAKVQPPPRPASEGGGSGPVPPADPTPAWARPFFQALTLHVGALRLAVPLVKLHRVVPWEEPDEVEPTVGQPAWMHGLLDHRGQYVQVVDTAELVLPEERRPPLEERRAGKIIIVGDGNWGLACREVGAVLKLTPEQVQWRSAEGRRRWLAGTVREHLCALVDTDAFADMLEREGGIGGTLAAFATGGQNGPAGSR